MTPLACDAAAIELETYAKELLATAATLRRFASTMASEPPATTRLSVPIDGREAAQALARHERRARAVARRAVERRSAPRSSKTARTPRGDTAAAVRAALGVQERSLQEVATRAKLNVKAVYYQLDKLLEAKVVVKGRAGHRMLYRLVKPGEGSTPRRSGSAAGTSAGSAGGSVPDRRASASDLVWNGTLERNGQAPAILPPRERKP